MIQSSPRNGYSFTDATSNVYQRSKDIESRPYNGPEGFHLVPEGSPEGYELRRLLCGIGWRHGRFFAGEHLSPAARIQSTGGCLYTEMQVVPSSTRLCAHVRTSVPAGPSHPKDQLNCQRCCVFSFFFKWNDLLHHYPWLEIPVAGHPPANIGNPRKSWRQLEGRENLRIEWGLSASCVWLPKDNKDIRMGILRSIHNGS